MLLLPCTGWTGPPDASAPAGASSPSESAAVNKVHLIAILLRWDIESPPVRPGGPDRFLTGLRFRAFSMQRSRDRERLSQCASALDSERHGALLPEQNIAGEPNAVGLDLTVLLLEEHLMRGARQVDAPAAVDPRELGRGPRPDELEHERHAGPAELDDQHPSDQQRDAAARDIVVEVGDGRSGGYQRREAGGVAGPSERDPLPEPESTDDAPWRRG